MNEMVRQELERAICAATRNGASREEINKMVDDEATKSAILETAKAAARALSVTIRMRPMECEVWRDPTSEDELFVVRFGCSHYGVGHSLKEFVRWFGEDAVEQVPQLPEGD